MSALLFSRLTNISLVDSPHRHYQQHPRTSGTQAVPIHHHYSFHYKQHSSSPHTNGARRMHHTTWLQLLEQAVLCCNLEASACLGSCPMANTPDRSWHGTSSTVYRSTHHLHLPTSCFAAAAAVVTADFSNRQS
jgi:hypothetical protein